MAWPSWKVLPKNPIASGRPVTVWACEYSCVTAKAMFIVPSVTINAGSLTEVTSAPLMKPISTVTAMPHPIAR
ncbi:hypothetical protein D3C81_1426930 [compost metagenome]